MSEDPNSRRGSSSSFGTSSGGYQQQALFEPGSLICFTYRVEALLARGGMGEVYKTRHTEIGTEHAIKIVRPDLATNEKIMELFRREASVLRTVRDDAIVGYDGVLRDEEGRVYLVMEFVDGPSLTAFVQERVLTLEEVRRLRDRLARGLAAAHDKGVIHRDMSPDNIILGHGDLEHAKIIDFGIAKLADSSATTIIGDDFAGRYAYASPEQIGLYGGHVDGRSDIYSLGLVLATAATGKALNMGEISESLVSVIEARKRIPDFSAVPQELRPELGSMLEPDPADRPQSMREVVGLDQRLRDAAAAAAQAPVQPAARSGAAPGEAGSLTAEPAARPASGERTAAQGAGRRWLVPALAASVAVIAAGGYVAWQQNATPSGAPPQTPVAESPAPAVAATTTTVAAPAEPMVPAAVAEAPAAPLAADEVAPAGGPAAAIVAAEAQAAAEAKSAAEAQAAEEVRVAAQAQAAEEARIAAEARAAEEARVAAEAQAAEEARIAAEAQAAEEARVAAEAQAAEEARLAAEAQAAEEARLAAEAQAAEEARVAAAAKAAEEARLAAEAQAAEEARLAAEAQAAEEARIAAEAQAAEEARIAAAAQEQQVAALPDTQAVDLERAALQAAEAGLTADQRLEIQRDLRALGHYDGAIDGAFGPGTRRAIERYQKVAGLDPTGFLPPASQARLAEQAAPLRAEQQRLAAADKAAADKAGAEADAARAQAVAQADQPAAQSAAQSAPGAGQQAALPNESEMDYLIRLAEGGDMLAQAALGQRYYRGDGVRRDYAEGVRWTRRAAEQGEARAQSNLGFYYMKGEGVDRNPAEAARWWRAAADQGLPQAQFNLGMLYEQGEGVGTDLQEAARWYERAAEQGDRNAADRLAGLKRRNLVPAAN